MRVRRWSTKSRRGRLLAAAITSVAVGLTAPTLAPAAGATLSTASPVTGSPVVGGMTWSDAVEVALPDGAVGYVRPSGDAVVIGADGTVTAKRVDAIEQYGDIPLTALPTADLVRALLKPVIRPYRPGEVLVAFRADGTTPDAAARTGVPEIDAVLAEIGASGATPLLGPSASTTWRSKVAAAEAATGSDLVDPARTYRIAIESDPVEAAEALGALPGVAYASPTWAVTAGGSGHVPVPADVAAAAPAGTDGGDQRLPNNVAIALNAQSHWNTPGLDAATAYDQVTRELGELPGTGETITVVGVGPLTSSPSGPCAGDVEFFGPTTTVIDGQRYVDMPAMPLIPTFTADAAGSLDPLGEACPRADPLMTDVALLLTAMAPLPHNRQREGAEGVGLQDLLGLAPGADYRLVVPAPQEPTIADLTGALIGAAAQEPAPTVIMASARVGGDLVGFPSRSLEDDALLRSIITTITQAEGITVVSAVGDGTTTRRATAYGPTGGGAQVITADPADATELSDVTLSTTPSLLPDSGSIMVGGTTLNDVAADPPHLTDDPAARVQQAYAAVRWTGGTLYASGQGDRVDLAAPGDSILGFAHAHGGGARDVSLQLGSGTGVAAAQVAAAAAVVRQVARATGEPLDDPASLRDFLTETARLVAAVPQALEPVEVGGQLDLGAAVRELFARDGVEPDPGVLRVAVAQRRPVAAAGAVFETWTDPKDVDLAGPPSPVDGTPTGRNARAWITIAPDWVGVPDDAIYSLRVAGRNGGLLATTRSARVQPAEILAAVGLPLESDVPRDLTLVYTARSGGTLLASATTTLRLGPAAATSQQVDAPRVDPVITGDTLTVAYDLTDVAPVIEPELVVSYPGRPRPDIGPTYVPALRIPLTETVGEVEIDVADLQGAGIYGVSVNFADLEMEGFPYPLYSDFAYTRVAADGAGRPPAPLLARAGAAGPVELAPPRRHHVQLRPNDDLRISWDVTGVPGAKGARLEVSAAGPTIAELVNTFNNPEGNERDANGNDTGSITLLDLPGASGTARFTAAELDLYSAMSHGLRVVATDASGAVVGSAGAVSSVGRDGVRVVGGGSVENGYGVDPGGRRGILTTHLFDDDLTEYGGAQVFNLDSMRVTGTPLAPKAGRAYTTLGAGVFSGKGRGPVGLVRETEFGSPVADWAVPRLRGDAQAWSGPRSDRFEVARAGSSLGDRRDGFVLRDQQSADPLPYSFVTGNVARDRFGKIRNVSGPLAGLPEHTTPLVMGYDAEAGTAGIAYTYDFFAPPAIEIVDAGTGEAWLAEHTAQLTPLGLDLLATGPGAGKVVFASADGTLTAVDIVTGASTSVVVPDGYGTFVNADNEHGLILVGQPNADPVGRDKNSLSVVRVYDADLQLVATLPRFNLYNTPLAGWLQQLQSDPSTRTGWFVGPLQEQLATFPY